MKTLMEIVSLRRPHGGANERYVAEGILSRLPYTLMVWMDKKQPMAYYIQTCTKSKNLFCAHLDTVHRDEATHNPVIHDTVKDKMFKIDGTPLGADDGAGIWLLYKMIEAGVKGTFLFPCGEERGGIGSSWLAENAQEFLKKFGRAIAFDRRGVSDVITHQGWGERCCSDIFAQALADGLNTASKNKMMLMPDSTGIYTDTKEFTHLIPECTNCSVGYYNEHTADETLNVTYLNQLLAACIALDWNTLPIVRDPSVVEEFDYGSMRAFNDYNIARSKPLAIDDLYGMTSADIRDLCWDDPEVIADMLIELTGADLRRWNRMEM